ncbi:hypothetical protein FOL47_010158 [Perkinsus chesapeaki]|uniref:Uncharacterized protein n=1 Tax=Perkinsus chesapeaki TaxID=330153 RepID=A0A7J6L393_PERCH|nr:hypothetical protein FOL47_010158 [Perkinsus chesapeaki]
MSEPRGSHAMSTRQSVSVTSFGVTDLHIAAYRNDAARVEELLEKSADPNAEDLAKVTPLHAACQQSDSYDVVRILLRFRCDVRKRDSIGHTPLHWATFAGECQTVRLLLSVDGGSDAARIEDVTRSTPLDIAERLNYREICQELKATLRATEMSRPAPAVITQAYRDGVVAARRSREKMMLSTKRWRPQREWRPTSV